MKREGSLRRLEDRLSDPDPSWRLEAACASEPELFTGGDRPPGRRLLALARAICASCDVFADCDAYAHRTQPTWGIWAGAAWHANQRGQRPGLAGSWLR